MKKLKYVSIIILLGLILIIRNPKCMVPTIDKLSAIWNSWEAWRNPLKNYGVTYGWDHGEHYEVTILNFWLQTDKGKIDGPSFIGDNLTVEFPRVEGDPIPEIVVWSGHDYQDVARLIMKDGKAVGFHIVNGSQIGVTYAPEGYYCP
jgi:hypothetical protein